VYAGVDPLTRQEIRLRSTVKDERWAQIELGRLLKEASEGRTPEANATMAGLMDQYAAIAEWDVSTRQTNEGFIRRTIKPALGHLEVRKVRGPILDKLYTRLKRCGDLSCTGTPFTEHRNIPALTINRDDSRPAWRQISGTLAEAIQSELLAPGDELPSITELSALQDIGTGVIRHAMNVLAADGQRLTSYDGWALSTSAEALPAVLALCPDRDGNGKNEPVLLVTTITDWRLAPAEQLARTYHQRGDTKPGTPS